jgi:medium-chain acyl-[acyl-carrier-protein] hydrolase
MTQKIYTPVWREQFQVRSFDIGLNAVMRMGSVCGYLQEAAGHHANHLDLGYHYMQQQGKVWVLSKLFMEIKQLPGWGQDFYAETWPLGLERIFYRRDYRIHNGNETMVSACSYWLLLDLKNRRPMVHPIDQAVLDSNAGKLAMEMPADSFHAVAGDLIEERMVKYSDIDQNRHVNNARYVEWIFDLVDQPVLEQGSPSFFAIEYKHEVKAGDTVSMYKTRLKNGKLTYYIEGKLSDNNQTCLRSKIVF